MGSEPAAKRRKKETKPKPQQLLQQQCSNQLSWPNSALLEVDTSRPDNVTVSHSEIQTNMSMEHETSSTNDSSPSSLDRPLKIELEDRFSNPAPSSINDINVSPSEPAAKRR